MTTGDRPIRVFTDRPPVLMSTVLCPGCGLTLDAICEGFERTPDAHVIATVMAQKDSAKAWHRQGKPPIGRAGGLTTRGVFCPATHDDLVTAVARAQHAQATANTRTSTTRRTAA